MNYEQKGVLAELGKNGRAKTVLYYPSGLYCRISIGRVDGDDERETCSDTLEGLPPEVYNKILDIIEGNDNFGDILLEVADQIAT